MASARDTIIAKVVTDVSAITVGSQTLTAYDAMPQTTTRQPVVWIRTDPVSSNYAVGYLDQTIKVIFVVQGARAVVSEALQKIAVLYETYTKFAGIQALGVVDWEVDGGSWEEPVDIASADTIGSIALDMTYRIAI